MMTMMTAMMMMMTLRQFCICDSYHYVQKEVHSTREAYAEIQERHDDLEKEKEQAVAQLQALEAKYFYSPRTIFVF